MSAPMAGLASRVTRAWNRFWFAEVDGTTHALVRIAFSAVALGFCGVTLPILREYYSRAADFLPVHARAWSEGQLAAHLVVDALGSYPAVLALFGLLVGSLVALLVGWRIRIAAPVAWLLLLWLQLRNPIFLNGGDEVLRLTAFYLAVGYLGIPATGRALSLDRRRALDGDGGSGERARIPAWPLRLIQVQIALLYVVTGSLKLAGETWWDGRAVYYAVANENLTRFGLPDWAWMEPLFVAGGLAVAWWEFLFPVLISWSRSRRAALAFGIAFHLGIFVFMNIGVFGLAMLATYPAFFHRERTADAVERILGRLLPGRLTVFYDGGCELCLASVRWLRRLAWIGEVRYVDVTEPGVLEPGDPGAPEPGEALRAMHVREEHPRGSGGRLASGFDGVRLLFPAMPLVWPLRPLFFLPVMAVAGRRAYGWVARNRYRLSRCQEACELHAPGDGPVSQPSTSDASASAADSSSPAATS